MPFSPSAAARGPSCAQPSALSDEVLAVLDHRHVEHARVLERAARQQRRRHRMTIVGDCDAAGGAQLGDVGELLAFLSARDRADRIHASEARFRGAAQDQLGDAGVIVHRRRIGHARDRGEAAGDRGRRAGGDRLLVLLPRLAQMDVHVDQAGTDHQPRRHVHDFAAIRQADRQIAPDARDAIAVDEQIERAVEAGRRVDHPSAPKQPLHRPLLPPRDTTPPCAPPRRWPPDRESPRTAHRPLRMRSRRRGSSDRDA